MQKIHKHILSFIIIYISLFCMHYFIYLWNTSTDIYLQSYSNTPLDLPWVILKKEIRPTYSNPFQKITYLYYDKYNPENIIIQKEQWFFHSDLQIIQWKNIVDKYFKESWYMFLTGFAVNDYPSVLYFIIFYLWIWWFIYNTFSIIHIRKIKN